MLKCQRFEDNESDKIELKVLKHQYMGMYDNKKR